MRVVAAVLDVVAPPRCVECGAVGALPWCDRCLAAVEQRRVHDPCGRCGGADGDRPHPCWVDDTVTSTVAPYAYVAPIPRAVVGAKTRGEHASWPPLGRLLGRHIAQAAPDVDAVTFVPTEPRRRRVRGVDHAAVLARQVATATDLPYAPLLRAPTGSADTTAPRGRRSRQHPAQPRFVARPIAGHSVLLVDDVLTTGVTAAAAARALLSGGAGAVHLAVLARAGRHALGAATAVGRPGR